MIPDTTDSLHVQTEVRSDRSRRSHFATPTSAGSLQREFEAFQRWVIEEGLHTLVGPPLVLATLVATRPLLSEDDVRCAYDACRDARRWHEELRIDWVVDGRPDAQFLSPLCAIAISRAGSLWPFQDARDVLLERMRAHSPLNACDSLGHVLRRASAYFLHVLGPMLFAHACGQARLTPLPRTALAREQSGQCLHLAAETLDASATQDRVYGRAFEAAHLGHAAGIYGATAFLHDLGGALRPPTKGSIASKRQHVLRALKGLAPRLDQVDECCALLFAFALMLLESGTSRKSQLAPTTPYDYVHSFAQAFHAQLAGASLLTIEPIDYANLYRKLLPSDTPIPSYRAAGLKEFHRFLRSWWTVPTLPADVLQVEVDGQVQANIVWPHECERVRDWIDQAPASRFTAQLAVAFAIAAQTMVRAAELFLLRIANVVDLGSMLAIEIARKISDGKEKSAEGRRRVYVRPPEPMRIIRDWVTRRCDQELAAPHDYLFGDPAQPERIADRGRTYFWLNKLLKAATGDDTIALHILRHSFGSQAMAACAREANTGEINPTDELASEAGHVGAHVTGMHYAHLYEKGIQVQSDTALELCPISYAAASTWTGLPEATLRKRTSRGEARGRGRTQVLWEAVREKALQGNFRSITEGIALTNPQNPFAPRRDQSGPDFDSVLRALTDCAAGMFTEQMASRVDLSPEQVDAIVSFVGGFAENHGAARDLPDAFALGLRALRDTTGATLGVRPDFARVRQDRWQQFARAIPRMPRLLLQDAVAYWSRSVNTDHLQVRPGPLWCRFAEFLSRSGINSSQVALATALPSLEPCSSAQLRSAPSRPRHAEEIRELLNQAQLQMRQFFGRSVTELPHRFRAGRPPLWLVISSSGQRLRTTGSANSMTGLNCLMLAAAAWLLINSAPTKEQLDD